jgi:branched-chain amino acid transport system ATP-binding protein
MSDRVLLVSDLHVSYGQVAVLKGVSLTVVPGEIVAVVGPSGAGKSTLLRSISGLVKSRAGQVRLGDEELTNRAPHLIVQAGIAHVPEGRRMVAPLSVEDNLRLAGAAVHRSALAEDIDRVYSVFPRLAERRSQLSGSLSGGEQQMLAIGRAMMARPRIVLLDEPSMGLAPIMIRQVYEALADLGRYFAGAGLLLAEQSTSLALDVATRVHVLSLGEIVMSGDTDALTRDEVTNAYLGLSGASAGPEGQAPPAG